MCTREADVGRIAHGMAEASDLSAPASGLHQRRFGATQVRWPANRRPPSASQDSIRTASLPDIGIRLVTPRGCQSRIGDARTSLPVTLY